MKKDHEIKKIINSHNLGGVIFFRPDELVMALGYYPTWGASFCLYPKKGQPIVYIPEIEPKKYLPKNCIIREFPYGRLGVDPWIQLYQMIDTDIKELGLKDKPLTYIQNIASTALPAFHGEMAPVTEKILDQLCMASSIKAPDISQELLTLYDIKTKEDKAALKVTHEVSRHAIKSFYDRLKADITEGELAALIELDIKRMMNLSDKKHIAAWCYIHGGKNTAYSGLYAQNTGKKLQKGEVVLMELAICVNGYWADITRSECIGKRSEEIQRIFSLVEEAQSRAVNAVKPGMRMSEVDHIARSYLALEGIEGEFNHALGHQVGFRYHDPGANLNPYSDAVLKEGMVITIEPGIYSEDLGFGVRKEDNILVTSDGFENLSQ